MNKICFKKVLYIFSSFFHKDQKISWKSESMQWIKTVMQIILCILKVKLNAEKYSFVITRKKAKSVIYFHEI